jgi:O-antigen/teichoic acid export membrane protein
MPEAAPARRHVRGVVLRNVGVVVVGRVASVALGLASSILLVRHFGSARLGEYTAVFAYVSLFAWLPTLGMDQVLVRLAARDRARAGAILGSAIALSLVLGTLAVAAAWASSFFFGYSAGLRGLLLLAALDLLLAAALRLGSVAFQLELRQGYTAMIGIGRQAAWVALVAVLVARGGGLGSIVLARAACGVGEALATLYWGRRVLGAPLSFSRGVVASVLRHAWPMGLSLLGVGVQQRIDQVLIHLWMGDRELGYYAVAVNIEEIFIIIPAAVMGTLLPLMAAAADDRARFYRICGGALRHLGVLAVGIGVTLTFAAGPAIALLYGAEYAASAGMLRALVWSLVPTFLGGALTVVFIADGKQRFVPAGAAVAALVNVGLNAVMIPRWGGTGAAWATVATYAVANVLFFAAIPATRRPAWLALTGSALPLAAGLAVVAAVGRLPLPGVAAAVLAGALYAGALFATGVWKASEVAALARSARRALPGRPAPAET